MDSLLYVDDEPTLLEIGTIFLERTGEFSVTTATGVEEALRSLESTSCDLVISDYQMPERDGIELLQEIRSRYPDLPFILFTGRGREEVAIRAFDLGADFYLQKGGDPLAQFAELIQKVRQAIRRRRAEDALKRREQQLNAMATNIPGVVYRLSVNPDGTISFNYISERSRQILGLENEPTTFFDQLTEQIVQGDQERFISSVRHAISTRTIWEFEGQYIKPSGKKIWISAVSNPLVEMGRLVFDGVIFNNTERKRAEEARRLSEEYYRALFQYTEAATVIIEEDGIISRANEAFADLWGEPSHAIEGTLRWTEFIALDDLELVKDLHHHHHRRVSPDKIPAKYGFRFVTSQGSIRNVLIHFGSIPGTGKSVVSLLDITEQKLAQEALILDEKRLEALVRLNEQETATIHELVTFAMDEAVRLTRSTIGYIAFYDEDERILTMYAWSKSAMEECRVAERPIRYPIDETGLWGEAVRQRSPVITNDYQAESSLKKGLPRGHVPLTCHMNVPIFDGDRIVIVVGVGNKPSDYDDADVRQLTLLMGGMWRIIQRKRTREALRQRNKELRAQNEILAKHDRVLRESETRFRQLAEATVEGIVIHESGIVRDLNERACELFGFSHDEMIGRDMLTLVAPEFVELIREKVAIASYEPYEAQRLRRDGSRFWADMHTHQITVDGEILRITTYWDITGRKDAEEVIRAAHQHLAAQEKELRTRIEMLRENELQLRSLIDESRDGLFILDTAGIITFANRTLARLFGQVVPDDIIGQSFLRYIVTSDREWVGAYIRRLIDGGTSSQGEALGIGVLRIDGSQCTAEVNASPIIEEGRSTRIQGSIR